MEFAKDGADVVITHLADADGAETTRAAVEANSRRAVVVKCEVSDESQVAAMLDQAEGFSGNVDILVNNDGADASGSKVAELGTEVWDRAIRTNVTATSSVVGASRRRVT